VSPGVERRSVQKEQATTVPMEGDGTRREARSPARDCHLTTAAGWHNREGPGLILLEAPVLVEAPLVSRGGEEGPATVAGHA
jgi:hypothetical protein